MCKCALTWMRNGIILIKQKWGFPGKSLPGQQNSMVHLTSSHFLALSFPNILIHYLIIWLTHPWNESMTSNSCMCKHGGGHGGWGLNLLSKARSSCVPDWQTHWLCHMAMCLCLSSIRARTPAFSLCYRCLSHHLGEGDRTVGRAMQPAVCKDP